ncbi:hypothetical protein EF910_32735 [Streptomyces sp. WAC07149]|uniref:hypothetical protein n=1 Tax=Streptomyces sp. WAC07149 TaxID=2487425 RepID=UPI000F78C9DD|nr:hypothetical protein [Streptomyces sp. WAC07149]RST00195.1 hypothetical protein EF910_32735 [Streptomyces sp. WAC07149]
MAKTPDVTVGPPDGLGWRNVTVNGKTAGKVRSCRELGEFLRGAGLAHDHPVHWLGGDSGVWPDQTCRRRTVGTLMFAGFFSTACLLGWIGWIDCRNALTFGGRLAGYSVLAAALVELAAALAAVDYWHRRERRYSGAVVLAGVVIVFLCSSSLILLQRAEHFTAWSVAALVFLVGSVAAGAELIRSRAWKALRHPQRIAIGAIVPTLLACVNLAYAQVYVPYATSPLITSGAEFREASLVGTGTMYVTVHVFVRNEGRVPVYVLGSIYWVHGGAVTTMSERRPLSEKLIYDGEFVTPAGRELNPGEEVAQDVVVEIKDPYKAGYEALRAQTEAYVVRRDRMTLGAEYEQSRANVKTLQKEGKWRPEEPWNAQYRNESGISNSSEILNIARGPQRITVWRVPSGDRSRIDVAVSPPGDIMVFDPDNPLYNKPVIERYGLSKVRGSQDQTPYQGLLDKARSTEEGSAP